MKNYKTITCYKKLSESSNVLTRAFQTDVSGKSCEEDRYDVSGEGSVTSTSEQRVKWFDI